MFNSNYYPTFEWQKINNSSLRYDYSRNTLGYVLFNGTPIITPESVRNHLYVTCGNEGVNRVEFYDLLLREICLGISYKRRWYYIKRNFIVFNLIRTINSNFTEFNFGLNVSGLFLLWEVLNIMSLIVLHFTIQELFTYGWITYTSKFTLYWPIYEICDILSSYSVKRRMYEGFTRN